MPRLKAGECQVMPYPNPADSTPWARRWRHDSLSEQAGLNIGYIAYNTTQKPPFDKPDVRQAMTMAIDKHAILEDVYQGAGQKAKNPIPPTMWSYDDADRRTTTTIPRKPRKC